MKKNVLMKVFLILLPAMAVALATTTDSVTVLNTLTGVVETYSYFDLIPVSTLQMCTPLAALLAAAAAALAIGFVAKGKHWCIQGVYWTAFLSMTAAALPILVRGETIVMPNVGFPIMMLATWLLAAFMRKMPGVSEKKPQGKRLKAK